VVLIPASGEYALTLTLAGQAVRGTVFESGGRPAAGAYVALFRNQQQLASGVTGDDGSFTFTGLPPGDLVVRANVTTSAPKWPPPSPTMRR
jgi:hypothetical protein